MLKKVFIALFIVTAFVSSESNMVWSAEVKETVDEVAVAKAREIRSKALKMKETATSRSDKRKVSKLLTKAADMETNAHKLGNKCKHGSHVSIETVKKNHKNCEACHSVDIKDGECARVPGDHKHHYCYCDC